MSQDVAITNGKRSDIRLDVIDIIKRAILWIIGYKREERERVSVEDINLQWVETYRMSIVLRFLPVYAFYILSLVVLTRPVYYTNGDFVSFPYSSNLHDLFALSIMYIISNVFFDYISLKYSLAHVMKAQTSHR